MAAADLINAIIIDQAARADNFSGLAASAVLDLSNISTGAPSIGGLSQIGNYAMPAYAHPSLDVTPTPVYEPTLAVLPTTPILEGINSVTIPATRTEPTLNTSGLFNFATPSTTLPTLDETNPNLNVDVLVAEMDAIVTPMLSNYVFPDLHTFSITAPPDLIIPNYVAPPPMDDLSNPTDYAAQFQSSYAQMAPTMQAFVDDKTSTWVSKYAPEYSTWVTGLQDKINAGFNGSVLTDQFEAAMFTRAQGRATDEYDKQSQNIYSDFSRNGFMEPPGTVTCKLFTLKLDRASSLANQATDIYIERRKTEIQHAQFCMNLASTQITAVRNAAVQYAQSVGVNMATSLNYAGQVAEKLMAIYDHNIKRSELRLSVLGVVDTQYNSKLKAALSAFDGYKIEIEAEKARTDLDMAKISQITAQMQAEGNSIQKYSALIDSVTRKAGLEELKIKEYGIRSDIFSNKIKAQLAGFDMYRAALSGDQSKLDGEMSKLKVFESLVHVDQLNLETQIKQITAQQSVNDSKVAVFKAGADVYKFGTDVALQKFTAQAEVKKLAQSIYGQELMNAIEEYKVGIELQKLMTDAILKEYETNARLAIQNSSASVSMAQVGASAKSAGASAAASVAAAAIGSLNAVMSTSVSASQ